MNILNSSSFTVLYNILIFLLNILKSSFVVLFLSGHIVLSVIAIRKCIRAHHVTRKPKIKHYFLAVGICLLTIMLVLLMGNYAYPFERNLDPQLVATIQVSPEHSPYKYNREEWHTVYEAYGSHEGTWLHSHEYYMTKSKNEWPEMDLENYTYIITYCQKIDSLTYNIWENIDSPLPSPAKEGHMKLHDEIDPLAIYIYRIPKMRINNPAL